MRRIRTLGWLMLIAVFPCSIGAAQRGKAPPGWYYYPTNYHGDTFTGEVVRTDGVRQLTLEYKHSSTSESFTGTIRAPCMAHLKADPHKTRELRLSAIRNGTVLTVFYNPDAENRAKTEQNTILAIRVDRLNGRELTNPRRPVISCSEETGPRHTESSSGP